MAAAPAGAGDGVHTDASEAELLEAFKVHEEARAAGAPAGIDELLRVLLKAGHRSLPSARQPLWRCGSSTRR